MTEPGTPGADLSNWRSPPFNAWAFHHVEGLLPAVEVANGPATARPPARDRRSLDAFERSRSDGLKSGVKRMSRRA